jgi:hypothetical protein
MLKKMAVAGLLIAAGVQQTAADGKIFVQLPDLTSYQGQDAKDFLERVVLANGVSSNCAGYEVTDEDWSLLTDSADLLAYGQLKLTTDDYDTGYYNPAFAALDEAGTCEEKGPDVEQVLSELVDKGGSREALPNQEAAYEEWRTLMDKLQDEANQPAPAKTKTK